MATIEEELVKLTASTTEYLKNSTAYISKVEADYKTADIELEKRLRAGLQLLEADYKAADVALEKRVRAGIDTLVVNLDRSIFRFPGLAGDIQGKLYVKYLATGVARCFLSIRIEDPSSSDQVQYWSIRLPDNLKEPDSESFGIGNTEFKPSTSPDERTLLRPCAVGTAAFFGIQGPLDLGDAYGAACTFGKIIDRPGAPDRNKFVLLITIPVAMRLGLSRELHAQWDYIF